MNLNVRITLIAVCAVTCVVQSRAQNSGERETRPTGATTSVAPGEQHSAGKLHRLLFGEHWRHAWATPIPVAVLDMRKFAGGLTPTKRVVDLQTKTLLFKGADRRHYRFRSLDRDPSKVLPLELREAVAADVARDHVSSTYPYAPLVVAPLLHAVGVVSPPPKLVLLPDDPTLGEHRAEFAGLLGVIEENPDARSDPWTGIGDAETIVGTLDLFERLEARNDERVDARAYLTARLMDVFLGDWDRNVDQWLWARVISGKRSVWKPMPHARDQAFAGYDGLLRWFASNAVTQLEGFSDDYPKIADLTWSGRHIDKRLLTALDRRQWDSVTDAVVRALSDEVIEGSVRQLPTDAYEHDGPFLLRALKSRRDALTRASDEFYSAISEAVNVYASNLGEIVSIARSDNDRVVVQINDRDDRGRPGFTVFRRTFDAAQTREIRIFLNDGDDSVHVSGDFASSITVRVIGGAGADVFADRDGETATHFYDEDSGTRLELGSASTYEDEPQAPVKTPSERYEPRAIDFGHRWSISPWLGYSTDVGVFVGGGPIVYKHGFQVDPYVYRMQLRAGYAAGARTFKAMFTGDYRTLIDGARVGVLAIASGIEVLNFYGFGNETPSDDSLEAVDFYTVRQHQYTIRPEIGIPMFNAAELIVGADATHMRPQIDRPRLVSEQGIYGVIPTTLVGVYGGFRLDTRDVPANAHSGALLDVRTEYFPRAFNNKRGFTKLRADARTFLTADFPIATTLALRTAGEWNLGQEYPFYSAAFLGGGASLRGFTAERFAGDASILGSAELRVALARFDLLFKNTFGITAAIESGRVFERSERSDRWHTTFGAGIFLVVAERQFTFSASAMQSPERLGLYVAGGFAF